jgi:Arf/Sar family protein
MYVAHAACACLLHWSCTQDMRGCASPAEVCEALGMTELRGRRWHVQSAIAIRGEGLYEGLDWLANTLKSRPAS